MQAGRLQDIYKKHGKQAEFVWIYIREAHPRGSRRPNRKVDIDQPATFEDRNKIAGQCSTALSLTIPVHVDDMKNTVATAYNAMPDRLFIVGTDGKIAYRGDRGPRGFKTDEMEQALEKLLAVRK